MCDLEYYPGRRIQHAYSTGQQNTLTDRENKALDEALKIVSKAKGSMLEREKAIHDALCQRISYSSDSINHNDDDCTIGALLNGFADCDGYADAFYLCCSLAGLQVRYQHGAAISDNKKTDDDSDHMWNLVYVKDQWLMTDVTWNDNDNGFIGSVYYNLDAVQAENYYVWDEQAQPVKIANTAARDVRVSGPEQKHVNSWLELAQAIRSAAEKRENPIFLSYPSTINMKENYEQFNEIIYSFGIESFDWTISTVATEIYNIKYYPSFKICDTQDDIIDYLNECRKQRASVIRIFCTDKKLYQKMRANRSELFFSLLSDAQCTVEWINGINEYKMLLVEKPQW